MLSEPKNYKIIQDCIIPKLALLKTVSISNICSAYNWQGM